MAAGPSLASLPDLEALRDRIDETLAGFLAERRRDLVSADPAAGVMVDELTRLLDAGGKRIRPILCLLGHRAAGCHDPAAVLPAAAALELFHLFALIHDDVMDDERERRGVASTPQRFAFQPPGGERFGRSAAILVGDLALVLSNELLATTAVERARLDDATAVFTRMALVTAAGQLADVSGRWDDAEGLARRKTGIYTVEAPLAIGAILGGGSPDLVEALERYARPLGVAFQLRDDDLDDGDDATRASEIETLVTQAIEALAVAPLDPGAAATLRHVASAVASHA
jgi:geranylgeranyl diphosphate synthase type I